MSVRQPAPRALACLVMLLAGGFTVMGSTAHAGDVPSSALAQATGLDPILLDSSFLIFQFPQMSVVGDSMSPAFAHPVPHSALLASTNGDEYGLGAVMRSGAVGGFVLSQLSYLPDGLFRTFRSNILQAGGGARWKSLRFGAAARASRDREENSSQRPSETNPDTEVEQDFVRYVEGSFGLGLEARGASIDAAFEWSETHAEATSLRLNCCDTLAVRIVGPSAERWGGAARATLPLGDSARLVAASQFGWGSLPYTTEVFDPQQRLFSSHHEPKSKNWLAGLGVWSRIPALDCLGITGSFEFRDEPFFDAEPFSGGLEGRRRIEVGMLGVAGSRLLWQRLAGQVGFTGEYRRERSDQTSIGRGSLATSEERSSRNESMSNRFTCGVTWSWRRFEFAGALEVPPRTDRPAGVIDVTFGL